MTGVDAWAATEDDVELPRTGVSLARARRELSGLHFSKEALSEGERHLLHLAEGLLRLVEVYREQGQP